VAYFLGPPCIYTISRTQQLQRRCAAQSRRTTWDAAQVHADGLWSVAIQPYAALVCRLIVFIPVIHLFTWITIHLLAL